MRGMGWVVLVAVSCGSPERPAPALSRPAEPRVDIAEHVERGLLPEVQVRGEPVALVTLADRMRELRVPGLGIAVFEDHELVWAGAYGIADVDTGAPVTTSTLFQAASISKPVNALAVLQQVAAGTFALDAPINDALVSWKLPDNELTRASPVTLRRLLNHTAGTTVHGFMGYPTGAPVPTLIQILDGAPPASSEAVRVDLAPGTRVRYSGGGVVITQLALVDRLHRPYAEIMREQVLGPLGMQDSSFEQPLPAAWLARAAAGHDGAGAVIPGRRQVHPECAAAGLWSTPSDLARFFAEVGRGRAGRSRIVPRAIALQMTTADSVNPDVGAGLGLFLGDHNGAPNFGHNGSNVGFQATAGASLDGGFGLVLMTNSDNGAQLFTQLARTVSAAYGWPGADTPVVRVSLDDAQRARIAGRYVIVDEGLLEVSAELRIAAPFGTPAELVATSPTRVVDRVTGARYELLPDGALGVSRGGNTARADRIPDDRRVPLFELAAGRHDAAVAAWKEILRNAPAPPFADENLANRRGYELVEEGKVEQALQVFRLVVAVFPGSSNAHDSLAENAMAAGDKATAIREYEAALSTLDADRRIPAADKPQRRAHTRAQLAALRKP